MNADHYTRLGQGRERNPSPQVVDALRLDADARAHLYLLGVAAPNDQPSVHAAERVSPSLR